MKEFLESTGLNSAEDAVNFWMEFERKFKHV